MPHYEYICQDCGKYSKLFFSYADYGKKSVICRYCQSEQMQRRISRIAVAKSEDTRMDALMDDSTLANLDEEDPKALGHFMRKMSREMGEDLGDEFNEVVDRLEHGEAPDAIEQSMPDLGTGEDDF